MKPNMYTIKLLRCIDCGDTTCPEAIDRLRRLGDGSTPQAARLVITEAMRRYAHAARLPVVFLTSEDQDVSLDEVRLVGILAALQHGERRAAEVLLRFSHDTFAIDGILAMLEPFARLLAGAGIIVTSDVIAPIRRAGVPDPVRRVARAPAQLRRREP